MDKIFVGVDPGKRGGVCVLNNKGKINYTFTIPIIKKTNIIDIQTLSKQIKDLLTYEELPSEDVIVILEDVHSIYGMSAKSNYSFGFVNGVVEALVVSNGYRLIKVTPREWQKVCWQGIKPISNTVIKYKTDKRIGGFEPVKIPNGTREKIDTKATSLIACKRLFPNYNFLATERSKKDHDGLVDSCLLSWYGYLKFK